MIPPALRGVPQVEIDFTDPRHLFDAWPALKATTVCTARVGIWKKSRLGETMEESSAIKATELNMDYFRAKRRFQYRTDISGTIIYFRALQGHSGRNLIDPSLQDNVTIQSGFFQQIYHVGCAFNLQSIINNGFRLGGQNSSKRQTVFFLHIDPRDEGHQDPATIDFNKPRRAQYMHSAWKKHQDAVFWVDINLATQKGLTFYQTRSNAIILQGTLPAYCITKVMRLKTGFYS